jgi:DnaJ family protein C protein 13
VSNSLAKLSVRACARLGGYLIGNDASPDNPAVKKSLAAMLTPYLSKKLAEDNPVNVRENSVNLNSEVLRGMQRVAYYIGKG